MNATSPLVSVCIPAYNAEKTIAHTLDSILGQTYRNIKIFISDNCSKDGTPAILAAYAAKYPGITIYRHPVTMSGEANFSHCIKMGEGDYTAIFHSDDIYTPTMVEEEVAALEKHKEAGAVFTLAVGINEAGEEVRRYSLPAGLYPDPDGLYRFEKIFKAVLKYGNFFFCPSVMARTSVYKNTIGAWDEEHFKTAADLDVWLRMAKAFPVVILGKPLLRFRLTAASTSFRIARSRTWRPDLFTVLDHYLAAFPAGAVTKTDLLNYQSQRLRDNINRAFNLLLKGERRQGLSLLTGLFSPVLTLYSLPQIYHLKVLLYGWAVLLLHFMPLTAWLKDRLFKLRFGS